MSDHQLTGVTALVTGASRGLGRGIAAALSQAGTYHAHALEVLTLTTAGVARIVAFLDPKLFGSFGLPETDPASLVPSDQGSGGRTANSLRR